MVTKKKSQHDGITTTKWWMTVFKGLDSGEKQTNAELAVVQKDRQRCRQRKHTTEMLQGTSAEDKRRQTRRVGKRGVESDDALVEQRSSSSRGEMTQEKNKKHTQKQAYRRAHPTAREVKSITNNRQRRAMPTASKKRRVKKQCQQQARKEPN